MTISTNYKPNSNEILLLLQLMQLEN